MWMLLLALQAGTTKVPPAPASSSTPEVVVVAKRLNDALQACRRGECSTRRDAQVTIAVAERYFRAGDYGSARSVLFAGIGRNRDRAAQEPRAVAALYEAYATVSNHFGDPDAYRRGATQQVRTLRENLPADDPSVLAADITAANLWIEKGKFSQADKTLAAAAERSTAIGKPRWAALAMLHRASLAISMREERKAAALLESARATAGNDPTVAQLAQSVELRMAVVDADDPKIDALVARVGAASGTKRRLIWAPPYPLGPEANAAAPDPIGGQTSTRVEQSTTLSVGWADIGFWIAPDGRTRQIEVLRGSRGQGWVPAMVSQVAARRYEASRDGAELPGDYRIERFSWRAPLGFITGSNVRQRKGGAELEVLELTEPSAAVTAAR